MAVFLSELLDGNLYGSSASFAAMDQQRHHSFLFVESRSTSSMGRVISTVSWLSF